MKNLESKNLSTRNKFARVIWTCVWLALFRPSPSIMHWWRRGLLRLFGAKVGRHAHIYPSCTIWAPWNLTMGDKSCLSHGVICYNVAPVHLGESATVSQYSHLCTATHDYCHPEMPLLVASIWIRNNAWVTADVFVGPGVTIGEGAIINARSAVFSDIDPWTVARGNPAEMYKKRVVKEGRR